MEEKYIRFYMSFYKAFQGKKSNSLFKTIQSRWSNFEQCVKKGELWKQWEY